MASETAILAWRDAAGRERIHVLPPACDRVVVGRGRSSDLRLEGDPRVSRTHAVLERMNEEWTVLDDRLSRNGTYVNGERVRGRRPLTDGDVLLMGRTSLIFRTGGGLPH